MKLRPVTSKDIPQLVELYQTTIQKINSRDYDTAQVQAWAGRGTRIEKWEQRITEQYFIAMVDHDTITGFGSIDPDGYLDMLFVHHAYQGQGIAKTLLTELQRQAAAKGVSTITTDASITARPFFEKYGFALVQQQSVALGEVSLTNFKLVKKMPAPENS